MEEKDKEKKREKKTINAAAQSKYNIIGTNSSYRKYCITAAFSVIFLYAFLI